LQVRLVAFGLATEELAARNREMHPTARSLLALDALARERLVSVSGRLAALLARVPLLLPDGGHHPAAARRT